jgi:hypothetical protein
MKKLSIEKMQEIENTYTDASIDKQKELASKRKLSRYILNDKQLVIRYKLDILKQIKSTYLKAKTKLANELKKYGYDITKETLSNMLTFSPEVTKQIRRLKDLYNKDARLYNGLTLEIRELKKHINYETSILDFNSFYELDLFEHKGVNIFEGIDTFIMYLLKYKKNANYCNFCDTFQISINDLRSQVNLQMMSNYLPAYLEKLQEYKVKSLQELIDIDLEKSYQLKNWLASRVQYQLRNYCRELSNIVSISERDLQKEITKIKHDDKLTELEKIEAAEKKTNKLNTVNSKLKVARQLSSMQGVNRYIEVKTNESKQNKQRRIKADDSVNNQLSNLTSNRYSDKFLAIYKPLIKSIEVKESCLQESFNKFVKVDIIPVVEQFEILNMHLLNNLNYRQLRNFYHCNMNAIKSMLLDEIVAAREVVQSLSDRQYYLNQKLTSKTLVTVFNEYNNPYFY